MATPPFDGRSHEQADRQDPVDRIVAQWAEERPDLQTRAMAVFGRIYRVADGMGRLQTAVYSRFGLSRGDFDVLATLRRSGPTHTLSPGDLAATLMLTSGGVTGRLNRLEARGLLRRSQDPQDRRGIRVTLTPEAVELIDQAVAAGLAEQRRVLDDALVDSDQEVLADLLRAVLLAIERA